MNDFLPFLLDERKISEWSVDYCMSIKDDPEIRKYIIDSFCSYYYCRHINDDPNVRKNITRSIDSYLYCIDVKNDPELREIAEKGGFEL